MNDEEASRPPGIKQEATAVKREWLFQSACSYTVLNVEPYLVGEGIVSQHQNVC
jgi:hypothetical protein